MNLVTDHPLLVSALAFLALWFSARVGATYCRRKRKLEEDTRQDFTNIVVTTLTVASLLIGFTFSMALVRYDLRKSREAEEANAIGTEYVRAELLPAANAAKVRELLTKYLEARISFYTARNRGALPQIDALTAQLQAELWDAVVGSGAASTPVLALAIGGMNDVLNSQGYTQAAWGNRIPLDAWALMMTVGVVGSLLVGYTAQHINANDILLMVLPFVLSVAWFLIADIDSPRSGLIIVQPQNLESLLVSLRLH